MSACMTPRSKVKKLVAVLQSLLELAERYEEQIESEWGSCRSLELLEAAGELPDEIVNARQQIALFNNGEGDEE